MTVTADRPAHGENRKAAEVTLKELKRMGRVEKIDAAAVQMLRSMADSLDAKPYNSQMFKEYRETLGELTADGDGSDQIADLLAALRDPPKT